MSLELKLQNDPEQGPARHTNNQFYLSHLQNQASWIKSTFREQTVAVKRNKQRQKR